jgi:hypothetical protein
MSHIAENEWRARFMSSPMFAPAGFGVANADHPTPRQDRRSDAPHSQNAPHDNLDELQIEHLREGDLIVYEAQVHNTWTTPFLLVRVEIIES